LPELSPEARERQSGLRVSCLLAALFGLGAWGYLAPVSGVLVFGPVAALAVLIALALADVDRGAPPSRAVGMTGVALLVLLLFDFMVTPEEALGAFGVEGARFPETFRQAGTPWLLGGAVLAALCFFAALLEADDPDAPAFARRDYVVWLQTVRDLWNGNFLFGACLMEAGLLGFIAFDLLAERVPAFSRFLAAGELTREGARVAWLVLPLGLALPLLTLVLRDAFRWLDRVRARTELGRFVPGRGSLAGLGAVACGAGLSLGYYPALARQLSPQDTFDAFRRIARPGEELAMIGTSSATAPYAAGRSVVAFGSAEQAYGWLLAPGPRRFLVLRADTLPGLNSRYRFRTRSAENLPILDGHSSEILLASNQLRAGETNQNPLARYLLARAPQPSHPLDANLNDALDVLGWDVTDLDGNVVRALVPGRRFQFVIYYRVIAPVSGAWETFVHIDGFQRRFNGDHPTLEGHYPLALWNQGDLIADRHEIVLEPNFTRGTYRVYFGLFTGSRRMPVRRGPQSDDRIEAGSLVVE
jgi:hypothetical protein